MDSQSGGTEFAMTIDQVVPLLPLSLAATLPYTNVDARIKDFRSTVRVDCGGQSMSPSQISSQFLFPKITRRG